jgi:hypothetical protein
MPVLIMLAALGAAAMAVYLVAVRCVSWDVVPAGAAARVRWWQRHAPALLAVCALVAVTGWVFA